MKRFWLSLIIVLSLAVPAYSADIRTGGGHIIQDEGSSLAARPYLDLTGDGISCSNVDATTTECNVGQAAIPAANYYVAGGNADGELVNYSSGYSSTLDFYPNIDTFTNPDFETDVTGWTCDTCGVAPTRSANTYVTGSYSMMFDANGASAIVQDAITVMAETPYTITAWVYDLDATNTIDLRIRTDSYTAGSNLCSVSTTAAFAGGWYRLSCSTSATNTDTSLYVQVVTNEDLTDIYVDDFQLTVQDRTPSTVVLQDDGFVTCKNSNCAAFDGAQVNINTADSASLEPTTGLTLSAWVFPTSEKNGVIVEKGATTQYSLQAVSGTYYDSKIQFKLTNNTAGISVTTTNAYNIYQWHHVVVQISGTAGTGADDTVYIYVDGTLVDTFTSQNYQMPAHATGVYIGSSTVLPGGFRGYLDDVRVYSAAISAADITTMYDSGNGLACTGSETSIVACWEMNEVSGTTAVSLPAGFNGTLANSSGSNFSGWRNCKLGNCIQFDGLDDYVEVKHTPDMNVTDTLSFSFWLYRGIDTGGVERVFSISDLDSPSISRDYAWQCYIDATDVLACITIKEEQGYFRVTGTNTISVGQWYHIVVTKSASAFQIYVNNTLDGSAATDGSGMGAVRSNKFPLIFGGVGGDGLMYYGFQGKIDDFQMYNVVLGTTPISTLYNSGTGTACAGTETDLKACWKFDETSGQVAYQVKNQTGLGSDSNNCTSTSTPCKTIQATINKIPQYYAGSATVHIASNGLYPENPLINGYNNSGDFSITFRGYNNPTSNQFTDSATLSGTSTGSNTANFPKDTLSLFNNTNNDSTANNATTYNTPTWLDGSPSGECGPGINMGNCINFALASSEYAELADNASLSPGTGDFTITGWFKTSYSYTANGLIYTDYGSITNNFVGIYVNSSNYLVCNYRDAELDASTATYATVVNDGSWHHFACIRSGTNTYLYVDGSQVASGSNASLGTITTSDGNVPSFGRSTPSANQYFNGDIDEFAVFRSALTQSSVRTLCGWNGSSCAGYQIPNSYAGLILVLHMNDDGNGGTTIRDLAESAFVGNVQIGDLFYIDSGPGSGTWARVQSKQSATQLALVTRWGTTPTSSSTYQVFPNKYLPKVHANNGSYGWRIQNSSGINLDRIFVAKAKTSIISGEFSQISSINRTATAKSGYIGIDVKDITSLTNALYNYSEFNCGEAFRLFKTSTGSSVSYNMFRGGLVGIAGYWGSSITAISTNLMDSATYYGFDWEQSVVSYGLAYNRISRNGYGGMVIANNSYIAAVAPNTITTSFGNGILISNNSAFNADFYGSLILADVEIKNHVTGMSGQNVSDCQATDRAGSVNNCGSFTYFGNTTNYKIASNFDRIRDSAPTVASGCGTSPTVAINSRAASGQITIGTGATTTCTLNFPATWANTPFCNVSSNDTGYTLGTSSSTTQLTITSSASMASGVIKYNCGIQP